MEVEDTKKRKLEENPLESLASKKPRPNEVMFYFFTFFELEIF